MAREVRVGSATVKLRSPLLVFVWSILTLSIYYWVWYYKVNRELRDAAGIAVGPFVAVLAITLGWIIVFPPFLSWWRTFGRIHEAQRQAGIQETVSRPLGFLLYVLGLLLVPVETIYAQQELNRAWRQRSGRAPLT